VSILQGYQAEAETRNSGGKVGKIVW